MTDFNDIKTMSENLKSNFGKRHTTFKEIEQMFFMVDEDIEKTAKAMDNGKLTLSPDARNQLLGAVRLMIATDPQFNVPKDENDELSDDTADEIEQFANQMWGAAGRIYGAPIHYDVALSGLLYGEVHIAIKQTKMLEVLAKSPADKRRREKALTRTPYLFEVWNPRNCYYEMDQFGLLSHFRRISVSASRVISDWGDSALAERYKTNKQVTVILCEWWDLENHAVWVEGEGEPIVLEQHGLDFIPIVVQLSEGSWGLFDRNEYQGQPFLYGVAKSQVWKRQNLMLTNINTNVHNFGLNPMYVYQSDTPGKKLEIDWSQPGGIAQIGPNESLTPMNNQNLIHPAVLQAMEIINNLLTESTIYKQVLGEPLGKNAPYSMVALLSQAGRLPLVSPQRRLGWGIAKAMEIAFAWMKADTEKQQVKYLGTRYELNPADIPVDLELECQLEVSLPQDDLQNANVAAALSAGDNPLASHAWVQENVLHMGQPQEMQKEIWGEKVANMFAMKAVNQMFAAIEQANALPPEGQETQPAPQGVPQSPNIPLTPGQPPQTAGLKPPEQPEML